MDVSVDFVVRMGPELVAAIPEIDRADVSSVCPRIAL